MALPLYAVTLFVSAFILFLVQPMIGKMMLPKLGGSPQVWNTCMVFFQTILLAGYAYTHFVSTRLKLKQQLLLHGSLILLPFLVLLIPWKTILGPDTILPEGAFNITAWSPDLGVNPIPSALKILLIVVGLPFFIVSTTAPLLQKWFVNTGHPAAKDPYFLYGASNLGSILGLLSYPFLIEALLRLQSQAQLWVGGFILLVVLVYACVALVWKPKVVTDGHGESQAAPTAAASETAAPAVPAAQAETGITAKAPVRTGAKPGAGGVPPSVSLGTGEEMTMARRLKWIALAAVPSSLMLGVTTHITTDLSPSPTIWLIPLVLYLASFILVFARWPVVWTEDPHRWMVYLQPIAIGAMLVCYFMNVGHEYLRIAIFFDIAGFFLTTMVCHGELARDRPSTKYLTEFYLMMSIGGMLGGMFNGLFAPNIPYLFEFPVAIMAACFLRPRLSEFGILDRFVAGLIDPSAGEGSSGKKGKGAKAHGGSGHEPSTTVARTLDVIIAIALGVACLVLIMVLYNAVDRRKQIRLFEDPVLLAYAIPLMVTCLFFATPLRYALSVVLIMLVGLNQSSRGSNVDLRTRGYFGLITVSTVERDERVGPYKQMIHGHINHGMNFLKPKNESDWGDAKKDYSRLATTYYHRFGPAGIVMEKFCWFKEGENEFKSDARIGASLVGQLAPAFGMTLPIDGVVDLWSEPPFATIGLGTGTMASYARPYQHMHYYEIDNLVKRLSLKKDWEKKALTYENLANEKAPQFTYLRDAIVRGAHVQVLMGDARLRMALPYKNHYNEDPDRGGGPMGFYHMMVVDAFSSDAIPAHLITKQAIKMYMDRLSEKGILCVHTSNRFVNLVKVVADVTDALNKDDPNADYACLRAHDPAPYNPAKIGHFTSEWVMVARKSAYLKDLKPPPGFNAAMIAKQMNEPYWSTPRVLGRYAWTDDYYNVLGVLRTGSREDD